MNLNTRWSEICNFQPLEVVDRGSETQPQVGENVMHSLMHNEQCVMQCMWHVSLCRTCPGQRGCSNPTLFIQMCYVFWVVPDDTSIGDNMPRDATWICGWHNIPSKFSSVCNQNARVVCAWILGEPEDGVMRWCVVRDGRSKSAEYATQKLL